MADMNTLLAAEQRSLLHARFGRPADRRFYLEQAARCATRLLAARYPHRVTPATVRDLCA